jgi:hypothetical protein
MIGTKRNIPLAPEERHKLEAFTKAGKRSVKLVERAAIILALDSSRSRKPDAETDVARRIGASRKTIRKVKRRRTATPFYNEKSGRRRRFPQKQPVDWKPLSLPWPVASRPPDTRHGP